MQEPSLGLDAETAICTTCEGAAGNLISSGLIAKLLG